MAQRMIAARLWRRGAAGLALGLALLVAACGPTGGGGSSPTPTVAPTRTPTPAPCAAWRIIPSPNATRYQQNTLAAVSALSPSQAWAVGANYDSESGVNATLIEQWDGSAWRIVSSPSAGRLNGVAAVSSQDVWAVGGQPAEMGGNATLIEHWNGTSWSIVPSPDMSAHFNSSLSSVVALAANDVWASGSYGDPGASWPLIERWDGKSWKTVANPDLPGVSESELSAVAQIPGTNQLWMAGYALKGFRSTGGAEQILIERWDGAAWKIAPGPTLPSGVLASWLYGVVALSVTDSWVVGSYETRDHSSYYFLAHWDGATWRVFPNTVDAQHAWLTSIAAAGPQDVRVSGSGGSEAQVKPIVMRWNGASWEITSFPTPPGGAAAGIGAMVADGAGGYWAVGGYHNASSTTQTLIERCS